MYGSSRATEQERAMIVTTINSYVVTEPFMSTVSSSVLFSKLLHPNSVRLPHALGHEFIFAFDHYSRTRETELSVMAGKRS